MVILTAAMPVIVTNATSAVKRLKTIKLSDHRIAIIRAVVAVLSLLAAALSTMVGDGVFDQTLVETAVLAVFNAVGATALYYYAKK